MIYLDSRYSDGALTKTYNPRKNSYELVVYRTWPNYSVSYFHYEWKETDRLDVLALRYLGQPNLWWQILDINPEIIDTLDIKPGTQIRIPNE
jgi:hypothetical protein